MITAGVTCVLTPSFLFIQSRDEIEALLSFLLLGYLVDDLLVILTN